MQPAKQDLRIPSVRDRPLPEASFDLLIRGRTTTTSCTRCAAQRRRRRGWRLTLAAARVAAVSVALADPPGETFLRFRCSHVEGDRRTLREVLIGRQLRDGIEPKRVRPRRGAHGDAEPDDYLLDCTCREIANGLPDQRQPFFTRRCERLRQHSAANLLRTRVRDRERHLCAAGLVERHFLDRGRYREAGRWSGTFPNTKSAPARRPSGPGHAPHPAMNLMPVTGCSSAKFVACGFCVWGMSKKPTRLM